MICRHPVAGALLLLSFATPRLGAQSLTRGDSLLAAGDSAAALAAYEAVVDQDWNNAEARYRAGMLRFARFVPGTAVSEDRRLAEEHFQLATRFESDSVKYWLALAEVFRTQSASSVRMQVAGLVDRAVDAGRRHGGTRYADAEYAAGLVDWEQYEHFARRYLWIGNALAIQDSAFYSDWSYVENFFRLSVKPDPAPNAQDYLRHAEDHLRRALAAAPNHVDAAGLLAVVLGEEDRWIEALEAIRHVLRAAPDSGRAWAVRGMALVRLERWREAARVFERALDGMTVEQSAPYRNLALILRDIDGPLLEGASPGQIEQLERLYWITAQPLQLRDVNEVRLEHFARVTYVDHRWSNPLRAYRGWESVRGRTWIRYGPPDIQAMLGRGRQNQGNALASLEHERNMVAWVYLRSRARFLFSITPGYQRTAYIGNGETWARELSNAAPVRFDNVAAVVETDTAGVQVAQFRGSDPDSTTVAVWGLLPLARLAGAVETGDLRIVSGVILRNEAGDLVSSLRRDDITTPGAAEAIERRTWRMPVAPGHYLMRVEADVVTTGRGARASTALDVRRFDDRTLQISDLLLAERATPQDSTPERWRNFLYVPSAGRFPPGAPVALVWEVYNLATDSAGQHRFTVEVTVTVTGIERTELGARVVGGVLDAMGMTAKGDQRVSIRYDRAVAARTDGIQVEHLTMDLGSLQHATYDVAVRVHDLVADRAVVIDRPFTVTDRPLTRR